MLRGIVMTACALVVDDDQLLLRLVELNLGKIGIEVLLADNGEEALKLASERRPDLVLLDIMMPTMDGYEVLRRLKENENTSDIPVIMLTARSSPSDRRRCEDMGALAYITKPFNLQDLRDTANQILNPCPGSATSGER
jgi:DNA-binding response OmpR family regulator